MTVVVTGSLAYDYIMSFPGRFVDHILPQQLHTLSVSFLVDSLRRERGGIAANIAYNLRLLNVRPYLMCTAGQDFGDYLRWLQEQDIDTRGVRIYPDDYTASFFVSTDDDNNQIASFYTGAMARARELSLYDLDLQSIELLIISPNDPAAMIRYAQECRILGIPYIYDPSQQIIRLSGDELAAGVAGARILTCNDYEFAMIQNKTGLDAATLLARVPTVVVTRGDQGSTIYDSGREYHIPVVAPHDKGEPTGVGDAYRAGLIVGFLRHYPWPITGRLASLAATYVLEQHGTQGHHYTRAEFVARYRQNFGDTPELDDLLTWNPERHDVDPGKTD